ncbi:MAG: glycosyltransferase [Lewinellaceae bacterium]|nr:glycosyltransferase [Lewinellaceae bacterium]
MTTTVHTFYFTVTNDLTYDQRMHRICGTLAGEGYSVWLIGRALPHSIPLITRPFGQHRLRCFFNKGFLFYAEFNIRLFFFLMARRYDAVCSIDLDTLPAGCLATLLRRKRRVFDAHEYFTEVPEVTDRAFVKAVWEGVARICLPFYRYAYTVSPGLAKIFEARYHLLFGVVRNVPLKQSPPPPVLPEGRKVLFYMGALNEGRGIETALEAMQHLNTTELWIAGEGDLSGPLRALSTRLGVDEKVRFLGYTSPEDLRTLTASAWLGLNLLENRGLSYYYSLANKFFANVQAGVPVLTMDYPEYRALNRQHEVAILLDKLTPEAVAGAIENLLENPALYQHLQQNCRMAAADWNWENEKVVLLDIWKQVFARRP